MKITPIITIFQPYKYYHRVRNNSSEQPSSLRHQTRKSNSTSWSVPFTLQVALLVGSILGAVVAFILLASLVYCLWRRRRIQHEIVVVSPFPREVRSAEEEPSSMEQRQTTHPAILNGETRPPKRQRHRIPRPSLPTREPKRARQAPVRIEAPVVAENHHEESVETNAEPTPDIDVVIQSENNPTSYRHQDSGWRDLIRSEMADGLREVIELPPDYSEV
ncbi:hypothetical protein BT96DRAFT_995100 [Gymnopus androsaceus JB14]|uniref:Uncharacterized protein n=1 Tax=Gymnopus androsaceus JB14 TaxID=1447944 RepID=A0A6A4HLC8_9AGAR|nr:hypothetical protein BT96DRAFT_995100 [Gymnopus androsaceus JB14]